MIQVPETLLAELQNINGFDATTFINAHKQNAETSIRLNPKKPAGLFETNSIVPWCSYGKYLDERPIFTLDPLYHAGAYYVQEPSSMFLQHVFEHLLKDKKGLRVLDLCAAPGGKSTLLASVLDKESLLVANETIRQRASILEENLTRWGYMNTFVTCNDPRDFTQLDGFFDVIVVDAPCSGSGLFRKDARALQEWGTDNVQLCSERQERILADVLPALKQGGLLVYATCSYSKIEDEQILDWLAGHQSMVGIEVPFHKEWGIIETESPIHSIKGYRFFPGQVRGEGFFIAALQKNATADGLRPQRFKSANDKKTALQVSRFFDEQELVFLSTGEDSYNAIYQCHEPDFQLLHKLLYFRKAGIRLGQPSQKEWLPAHDIALSINAEKSLPSIELNKETALKYLKKEDIAIEANGKGWHIIKHNGLGLGWAKLLGNRINNYLPKHWRIRMELE